MDRQRRTTAPQRVQIFALWHARRPHRRSGDDHRLANTGQGQFPLQRRRCRGIGRHARCHIIVNAQRIQTPHLFRRRAINGRIARMHPRHIQPLGMGILNLCNNFFQIQRGRINHPRPLWCFGDNLFGHQRSRIQTNRTGLNQFQSPHRNQIRRAGSCSNKMNCHSNIPCL